MIHCTNLHKSYGNAPVLRGVNLSVETGSIAALMGRSGVGKTTLLRILAFVDSFDAGVISVAEFNADAPQSRNSEASGVWPLVTLVFQDLFLWPHMTNRRNIMLPAAKRHAGRAQEIVTALIDRLDLSAFLDRFPNEVSRGQRQVVAIARALALNPKVLLLDEATASLDMPRALALSRLLRERAQDGMTILFVTHQLGFARHTADQVIFLDSGVVEECGPTEVLNAPSTPALQSFITLVEQTT